MSDHLDQLFSRLKSQSSETPQPQSSPQPSIWAHPQPEPYQQASVSSPLFSPSSQTPNPVHSSNIISPVNPSSTTGTPAPAEQNKAKNMNLLDLLRSGDQGRRSSSQSGPMASLQSAGRTSSGTVPPVSSHNREDSQSRPLLAQDLAASLQRQQSGSGLPPTAMTAAGAEKPQSVASPTNNSKDFLLNLLKKPNSSATGGANQTAIAKPVEASKDEASLDKLAQSFADASIAPAHQSRTQRETTPVRQFGSPVAGQTKFEAPQPTKATLFNYVNPFDQLHSSSPLNRTPKPENAQPEPKKIEILKHNRDASSALNSESNAPAAKSRKLAATGINRSPSPMPAGAGQNQSVSEALENVGEKVDREVDRALKKAEAQEVAEGASKTATADTGDNTADDRDVYIKSEPAEDGDDIDSSWESAEDDEAQRAGDDFQVEVYNFPMKPWVSIQVKAMPNANHVRQENFTVIARLKKDFDQIDRSLVTASQSYIIYAQVPHKKVNGGLRIIHQDSGQHKQVFNSANERMFNLQICTSTSSGDVEAILGTGVNGTVFWTSLAKSRGELFSDDDVEAQGFIMPPVATPEEQASGSPVKTRTRVSSRHPEFLGMARGNVIHIIASDNVKSTQYCNPKTRRVSTGKYLAEHGLRIMTGKAGKDFCFSEDDTAIVSLDKSGRFKFWDIKELTSRATDTAEGKHDPVELREPIWSLSAATSGSKAEEKPSVSSIMFLDKERPTIKGVALRYVLIGFKQNHVLQLWDLGLGKAVQEVRLPHEKDSDGICSITYHPRSGIIAVGHPTRNSIYLIHLSAPRYSLATMDQAKYINMLARGDPSLPRPESTAIMSGLRELSLAKVGELRSLDMLRTPVENASEPDNEDATLFELYVMHSKGVVCMSIKRKDLGWDKDSKMVKPVDGIQAGAIEVKELVAPQKLPTPSEQSSNADTPSKQPKAAHKKQEALKASAPAAAKNETVKRGSASSLAPPANGAPRSATPERASKQVPEAPLASEQDPTNPPIITSDSYSMAAQRAKSPTRERAVRDAADAGKQAMSSPESTTLAPQVSSNDDLQAMLNTKFDALYQRIDSDKRVVDAAGSARQDAMLRLVSSTLTENVEKSLNRIVSSSIEKEVIPAITDSTSKAVEKKLAETLPQQLDNNVSREVKNTLPQAIQQALKDQQVQRMISEQVATKVQQQVSQLLQQSMPNIATSATQKMVSDLDIRTQQQMQELERRHEHDASKIQELSDLVRGLSETVRNMSESQAAFQEEILKMQQASNKADTAAEDSTKDGASTTAGLDPQAEAEDLEVKKITELLTAGQYDAATLEWLQSARQAELFDQIFVRVNPKYLERLTPLLGLSVSAAITASFESSVEQRLEWLGIVLNNINLNDEDVKDIAGKIMDVLSQRLQGAYMQISERDPNDTSLRHVSALFRQVGEVRKLAG
ncbi:hypothetical protein LTR37_013093 [Vermiconidia calcicola]|uniref:Uncharacterized protein n=1 Tax=Vermiconidia calcicola TaxID=1690605 RepID=A0ACC3MXB6_9PEZI|nr:hypothetical protein LTR37_013093 [Vermiconidia calcicola]